MTRPTLIALRDLSKSYHGICVLDRISLDIGAGEVHAICGENGAGKSTLIKILTGVVTPDAGVIEWQGSVLPTGRVAVMEAAGIAVMHQESTAFPDLNAVDNLFVGREWTRGGGWFLRRKAMAEHAATLLRQLGESIDLTVPVGRLPLAQRQMVTMARALLRNCRLLIMDEPTASLSARETDVLLGIIRQLRADGVTVVYVSHRLEEVFAIADRITVLRDGQRVQTAHTNELTPTRLVDLMVGRALRPLAPLTMPTRGPDADILRVDSLGHPPAFAEMSLSVARGEIVGLAGLVGAGRSELLRAIFGVDRYAAGHVAVNSRPVPRGSISAAICAGMALVPEDRQHEGLALPMTVSENMVMPMLRQLTRWGIICSRLESTAVDKQIEDLQIRTAGRHEAVSTLSGGNQQKVVLGRWLAMRPEVLLLDEPTRGVDVGAKTQIHALIRKLAAEGKAVLMVSSELPELMSVCHRILVMREGRLVGERSVASTSPTEILQLALPDVDRRER